MSLSAASVSSLIMGLGPPRIGLASSRPSVWAVSTQRYTLERPTANRRAAPHRHRPPPTPARPPPRPSVGPFPPQRSPLERPPATRRATPRATALPPAPPQPHAGADRL